MADIHMFQDLAFIFKSPLRTKIVTFFVRQSGEWTDAIDVASVVGSTKQTVSRELTKLLNFGILSLRQKDKTNQYCVNDQDELFEPLSEFLSIVTNPTDKEISESFKGVRGVVLIIAAGLLANEPKSSLELLVVTKYPEDKKVDKAIRRLESCASVPLRYTILDEDEYYDRRQSFDRLLRDVFEYKHRVIVDKAK